MTRYMISMSFFHFVIKAMDTKSERNDPTDSCMLKSAIENTIFLSINYLYLKNFVKKSFLPSNFNIVINVSPTL